MFNETLLTPQPMPMGGVELTPEQIPFPTGNRMLDDLLVRYFDAKGRYQKLLNSSALNEQLFFDPEDPETGAIIGSALDEKIRLEQEMLELSRLIRTMTAPEPFISLMGQPMMTPGAEQLGAFLNPTPMMAPNTPPVEPGSQTLTPEQGAALLNFFNPIRGVK